jgi:transposase
MVLNGRLIKEVAEILGIGKNLIYRWPSRKESKETENAASSTDQQALLKRIRELETERNIKKSLSHFQSTDLKERYNFVKQHTAKWPVQVICQVSMVSGLSSSTEDNQRLDQFRSAYPE